MMNLPLCLIRRLLQNVGPRVKAIPDTELVTAMTRPTRTGPEEENGTGEGAASPSAVVGVAKGSGGTNNSTTTTNNNHHHHSEGSQDGDIDVVQQDSNNEGASTSSNHEAVATNHSSSSTATGDAVGVVAATVAGVATAEVEVINSSIQ